MPGRADRPSTTPHALREKKERGKEISCCSMVLNLALSGHRLFSAGEGEEGQPWHAVFCHLVREKGNLGRHCAESLAWQSENQKEREGKGLARRWTRLSRPRIASGRLIKKRRGDALSGITVSRSPDAARTSSMQIGKKKKGRRRARRAKAGGRASRSPMM